MGRGAGEERGGGGARRGAGKGREAAAERSGETGRRERESGLEFEVVGGVYCKSVLRGLFIKRKNSRFFSSLCRNKF